MRMKEEGNRKSRKNGNIYHLIRERGVHPLTTPLVCFSIFEFNSFNTGPDSPTTILYTAPIFAISV